MKRIECCRCMLVDRNVKCKYRQCKLHVVRVAYRHHSLVIKTKTLKLYMYKIQTATHLI